MYGRELREARDASRRYLRYGDPTELDKAWDIYLSVFRKLEKQIPQLTALDLQYVSPELFKARHLQLAVDTAFASAEPMHRRAVAPGRLRQDRVGS